MNNHPIGIFDSGVGGLTVWKTLLKIFKNESFVYYADNKNCPYGNKTDQEITDLSKAIVEFLIAQNCKMIIVACNTATSAAIQTLRSTYTIPIVGIEPAIKPASILTKTGNVGVLATQGTINGGHFKTTSEKFAKNKNVITQIGYGLVKLVEENKVYSVEMEALLKQYIEPMLEEEVDYIVLGCTHYPLLTEQIHKITGGNIELLEPSEAIAKQTRKILEEAHLLSDSPERSTQIYTSGDAVNLIEQILEQLKIDQQEKIEVYRLV
ncbi:MAG: glutamate racemase [Flavobacteriales bacterium]|jgi:glutamate racemase|nr:glutamate racemase [Flavobacteriales bacterium]